MSNNDPIPETRIVFGLRPNRRGYWVFEEAADGALTERELSREEWQVVNERDLAAENLRIDELNQHPLNRAAAVHLANAPECNFEVGSRHLAAALKLAVLALPDFESRDGYEPWTLLAEWSRSFGNMQEAINRLEENELDADEIARLSPRDAAEAIALGLGLLK